MKYIKDRVRAGEVLFGTFINLGAPLTAEILGLAGYDWGLIDLEHGAGDEGNVLAQIQAMEHTLTVPIVRIESGSRPRFHRPLDFGAAGIMVPRVDSVEQAREAIARLHYPSKGTPGIAQMNRACEFGAAFCDYMAAAADQLLGIVQIESPSAVRQADEIAALDGVDVLFVGPSDLSHSMGIFGQTEHPFFLNAFTAVAEAAQKAGKACGILLRNPEETQRFLSLGYTFLACGSDASLLRGAAQKQLAALGEAAALSSAVNSCATGVISR